VDNSTVVAGLMAGEAVFFFEDDEARLWKRLGRLHGERHSYDAAADYCNVVR
jgi:hypothetical protein